MNLLDITNPPEVPRTSDIYSPEKYQDPESKKVWDNFINSRNHPSVQGSFNEAWEQSGSPYLDIADIEYDHYGRPKGGRASFRPGTETTPDTLKIPGGHWQGEYPYNHFVDRAETRAVIAELAHSYQFNQPSVQNKSLHETWGDTPVYNEDYVDSLNQASYEQYGKETFPSHFFGLLGLKKLANASKPIEDPNRYNVPGNVEYQAHRDIEPFLYEKMYGVPPRDNRQHRHY